MADEEAIVVCEPCGPGKRLVPGSVVRRCSRCGGKVWLAPAGQAIQRREGCELICVPCAERSMLADPDAKVRIEPEVVAEAARTMYGWRHRN